jgi:DNA polymerase-3 subunit delta'
MTHFTEYSQLIGNDPIKGYLKRMVERKAIANSMLFAGIDGIGKGLFAQVFAAELMGQNDASHLQKIAHGNHPDLYHYYPEGKLGLHSIQTMRQFSDEVYLPPYEAKWKVFIIHEAERMLTYSANALLKTFEEPPPYAIIILLSSASSSLLPTILSRCRTIHFQAIPDHDIASFLQHHHQLEQKEAERIAHLSQGSLGRAVQLIDQKDDNSLRHLVLNLLITGKFRTYKKLTEAVLALTEQVEKLKKQSSHKEDKIENLSSFQQNALEKELEGFSAINQMQSIHVILDVILSWYRDLHLLLVGGKSVYLINQDYHLEIEQALQKGFVLSLEEVQKNIAETQLALQRSTSLQVCLENLFLKLNLV